MPRRGSAVIEVLLALSLAAFLIASLGNLISSVRKLEYSGDMRERALTHARFALELVTAEQRKLFACTTGCTCTPLPGYTSCWTDFTGDPLHLQLSGGVWQLAAGAETVSSDTLFSRSISVANASRDGSGALVSSGGTPDSNTKLIRVTVGWNERGDAKSLSLATMLTGWANVTP